LIGIGSGCSINDDRSIDKVFITGSPSFDDGTSSKRLVNVSDRFSKYVGTTSVGFVDEIISFRGGGVWDLLTNVSDRFSKYVRTVSVGFVEGIVSAGGGNEEFSDLFTNVSDRTIDTDEIVSLDSATGGGETFSVSVSNVSDRFIDFLSGIFSINGDAGFSVDLSNVPDRGIGNEKSSVLVGIVDLIGVIFSCSAGKIFSFVRGKLLEKSIH
jgi:hypothetical protein